MNEKKLMLQLFIGKVSEEIGMQKTMDLLTECENEFPNLEADSPWLSPVESEKNWQERHLKKLFLNYPNNCPKWQYMNGLIIHSCNHLEVKLDYTGLNQSIK